MLHEEFALVLERIRRREEGYPKDIQTRRTITISFLIEFQAICCYVLELADAFSRASVEREKKHPDPGEM